MDETGNEQTSPVEGEVQELVEGGVQTDTAPTTEEGTASKPKETVQPQVSEPAPPPKTVVEYVPVDQVRKMQSSHDRQFAEQQKLIDLMGKALQSRQRIDPLSENAGQFTKEEVAYESYKEGLGKKRQAEIQAETQSTFQQSYNEIGVMLATAGIKEGIDTNKTLAAAYKLLQKGDYVEAKDLVNEHIQLRGKQKNTIPEPPPAKPAVPKGAFKTGESSGASSSGASDAKFLKDYAAGKSSDHKRAQKLLNQ